MWAPCINILLGLWLMVAPEIRNYEPAAADNGHITGPLIVTFSTIALWEATYGVQKWNLPVALWLLMAPWILGYNDDLTIAGDMATGILIFIFSLQKRTFRHRFGGGWSSLWKKSPDYPDTTTHDRESR